MPRNAVAFTGKFELSWDRYFHKNGAAYGYFGGPSRGMD